MTVPVPPTSQTSTFVCFALYDKERHPRAVVILRAALEEGLVQMLFEVSSWQYFAILVSSDQGEMQKRLDTLNALLESNPSVLIGASTRAVIDRIENSKDNKRMAMAIVQLNDTSPEILFEQIRKGLPESVFDLVQVANDRRIDRSNDVIGGVLVLVVSDSASGIQRGMVRLVQATGKQLLYVFDPTMEDVEGRGGNDNTRGGLTEEKLRLAEGKLESIARRRKISEEEAVLAAATVLDWIDLEIDSGARFYRVKQGFRRKVKFRK